MKTARTDRFSVLKFRNAKLLRNRVVVPPMASSTADVGGYATEATFAHYARLATSGAGLVMVEYTFVDPSGRSEENQLGISSDAHVAGLTRTSELIHASGALAGIQLTHCGGKTERALTDGRVMGPSDIAVPVKDREMEQPTPMSLAEIEEWKEAFFAAADRAVRAGFDLVEFHAAHGYGLNQWLSPLTNRREDQYGGSLLGRARLLFEIVEGVWERHPGLLLAVRIPGQDFLEGGLTIADMKQVARELERIGVDVIDVSSGIGGWRRPRDRVGEGYLVSEAAEIQSVVSVPVIGVGGIQTGEYIDERLAEHSFSLAAVGRAILEAPREWSAKVISKSSESNPA